MRKNGRKLKEQRQTNDGKIKRKMIKQRLKNDTKKIEKRPNGRQTMEKLWENVGKMYTC